MDYNQLFKDDASFKLKDTEPFLSFITQTNLGVYFYPSASDEIKEYYKNKIDPYIIGAGFVKNALNTWNYTSEELSAYRIGYSQGNKFVVADIHSSPESTDPSRVTTYLNIGCGEIDPKIDTLYSDLLAAPVVIDALDASKGDRGVPYMILNIWGIYKDETIIYTNVQSFDWGGGHTLWFYKDNGQWKQIYAGQERPECQMLERLGIEDGVECLDRTIDNYRKTGEKK